MRVLPFIIRPSGLTLSPSEVPGRKDCTMSLVDCLRQYSRVTRLEPASRVRSEWMRRKGGFTVMLYPGMRHQYLSAQLAA
jgi:hypothetical protein